ncbi:hemerythrin family protein [Patescibacteria group bacterium]|nr:hemerythrin family protein [Patescibacteria group bacterium]
MQIKFEWTPDISVGNEEIDDQHKKLLNKINELLEAIFNEKEKEVIGDTISFLGQYIKNHLVYEENYMKENMYPDLMGHQEIHQNFVDKYEEFETRFRENGTSDNMLHEVEAFLGDWWVRHIAIEDKKYFIFINENK